LKRIEFIDFTNEERFKIEDISTTNGPKAIIDAADRGFVERFRRMSKDQRNDAFRAMQGSLTSEEINILLGRRQGPGRVRRADPTSGVEREAVAGLLR
jgi:hypothetical protein